MTAFRSAFATDAGRVRSSNQDLSFASNDLVAVADGMGGHVGGEIAARLAVESLQRSFVEDRSVSGLVAATTSANEAIFEQATEDPTLRGMGTTLTAAAIVRSGRSLRLVLTNVGDSRAYLLREGRLRQLTEDHSLVEEMVRNGELTPEAAAVHPHRHILTRALGIDRSVSIDTFELEPTSGSRLLLCSDGLTNECSDAEILHVLVTANSPQEAADQLVRVALEHGGSDNVTVVVADIDGSAPSPSEESGGGTLKRLRGSPAPTAPPATSRPPVTRSAPNVESTNVVVAPKARKRRRADRVLSVRIVLFVVILVSVLGGAVGFVGWWIKASYFVGLNHGEVAIFEGRPHGFLWFKPELVEETSLSVTRVYPQTVGPLTVGILESSLTSSEQVVANLLEEHAVLKLPTVKTTGALGIVGTTTTTTSTTTTTTTTTTTIVPTSPSIHVHPRIHADRRISGGV